MISLDDARSYVFSLLGELAPIEMGVDQAHGCVAAADVVATEEIPGFANSSMDGFALCARDTADTPVRLRIVDSVLAGGVSHTRVAEGEATRIMTGAPLPEGADCVEMIEEVEVATDGSHVTVHRRLDAGNFVRHPGDDIKAGDRLIEAGDVLHATRLGVLASQGVTHVRVHPRPRVGVMSTGNELTIDAGPLRPGTIRDVNRPLLLALLRDAGVDSVDLGTVRDDYAATRAMIERAVQECDVVVSTGGVSAGDVDYVKAVIIELAGETGRSLQIAVRPGKPFAFGVVGDRRVPVFGLPGNPVSTRVGFELFVRPSLRRLGGHRFTERLSLDAVLDCDMARTPDGRVHMVHVSASLSDDGRVHVTGVTREGSHLLHAVSRATAIAAVPDGTGLATGDTVRLIVLHPEELTAPTRSVI